MGNQPSGAAQGGDGIGEGGGGGSTSAAAPAGGRRRSSSDAFRLVQTNTQSLLGFRSGALNLSRAELDRRTKPSGLYPNTPWDPKAVRRLVGDGRLAARLVGFDGRVRGTDQECPICFLNYRQVNVTKCCHAAICTECYLQVRPQKDKASVCPFCNHSKLEVTVAKELDDDAVKSRQRDEQLVIEAQIQARGRSGSCGSNVGDRPGEAGSSGASSPRPATPEPKGPAMASAGEYSSPGMPSTPPLRPGEFGSALQRHRTESMGSASSGGTSALTLTPTERSRIHASLQSQASHPLAHRMAEEARQRREENELDYYRANSGRLLQRYEDYQRRHLQPGSRSGTATANQTQGSPARGNPGFGDDAALAAVQREQGREPGRGDVNDPMMVIEAALMLGLGVDTVERADEEGDEDGMEGAPQQPDLGEGEEDGGGIRRRRLRSRRVTSTHIGTAGMLMRGISEEDQLAMAIALSLRDESHENENENENENRNDELASDGGDESVADVEAELSPAPDGNGDSVELITANGEDQASGALPEREERPADAGGEAETSLAPDGAEGDV